jgi:hypothetical protein
MARRGSPVEISGGVRCPICGLWFKNQKALNAHMRLHKRQREKYAVPDNDEPGDMTNAPQGPGPQFDLNTPQGNMPTQPPMPIVGMAPGGPGDYPMQGNAQALMNNPFVQLLMQVGSRLIDKYVGGDSNQQLVQKIIDLAFDSLNKRLSISDIFMESIAKALVKNPNLLNQLGGGGAGEAGQPSQ